MHADTINCPTCGAAIANDSTKCRYCGTALATVALEKRDGRWLIYALQNIRLTGEPAPRAP